MMAGYKYYPEVGDPDKEDGTESLLASAAGGTVKAKPTEPDGSYGLFSDYEPNASVERSTMAPMAEGYGGTPPQVATSPMGGPPLGEEPMGGIGPHSPQPFPGGPQNIPTNNESVNYDPTPVYQQQQPAPTGASDAWTYEQTWIDPFIKQNLMQRDPVQLQSTMADIAAGQMSPVIQQQRERAMQQALAAAASVRGAPASATHRAMTQQMAEADRSAMEAAAQQQLQAGQQVDEMARADAQINAQLEQQRDSMLDSLVGRGVDRNVALAQVNAELDRLKEDLTYKYWAGRLGSTTEVIKQGIEHADFLEGGVESVAEVAPVINMLMGAPTPEGYGIPTTRVLSDYTDDPQGIFTQTTTGGAPGMDEMYWDHGTQSWQVRQGAPGVPQSLGVQDFAGQQVEVFRTWNEDKQIYEYSFEPAGGVTNLGPTGAGGGGGGGASSGPGGLPPEEPYFPPGGAPL